MSLNVYHLEVFHHVAKHGSVSRAAESMQKEQPTISALIAELERSLGDI
jgi:DNA-binding transcriptional LysR family regulator